MASGGLSDPPRSPRSGVRRPSSSSRRTRTTAPTTRTSTPASTSPPAAGRRSTRPAPASWSPLDSRFCRGTPASAWWSTMVVASRPGTGTCSRGRRVARDDRDERVGDRPRGVDRPVHGLPCPLRGQRRRHMGEPAPLPAVTPALAVGLAGRGVRLRQGPGPTRRIGVLGVSHAHASATLGLLHAKLPPRFAGLRGRVTRPVPDRYQRAPRWPLREARSRASPSRRPGAGCGFRRATVPGRRAGRAGRRIRSASARC